MFNERTSSLDIASSITARIKGWCGAGGAALGPIAEVLMKAEPGDHVEIGSLFGASAIAAAKAMKEAGWGNKYKVYCIDPMIYNEHEACCTMQGSDTEKLMLSHQKMIFMDNTRPYKRIQLIQARSQPWPFDKDKRFSTAFVDGWHYDDVPLQDVKVLVDIVDNYILVDDMQQSYPSIMRAIMYLMEHPDWEFWTKMNRTAVFVRMPDKHKIEFTKQGVVSLVECEA